MWRLQCCVCLPLVMVALELPVVCGGSVVLGAVGVGGVFVLAFALLVVLLVVLSPLAVVLLSWCLALLLQVCLSLAEVVLVCHTILCIAWPSLLLYAMLCRSLIGSMHVGIFAGHMFRRWGVDIRGTVRCPGPCL